MKGKIKAELDKLRAEGKYDEYNKRLIGYYTKLDRAKQLRHIRSGHFINLTHENLGQFVRDKKAVA